jgi:hypothetical protein
MRGKATVTKGLPFVWLCILLACVASVSARTWYLKPDGTGDAPSISAGGDSAASGDTLLLADGTYTGVANRHVYVHNRTLTIVSESGNPEACIVDCGGSGDYFVVYAGWEAPGILETPGARGNVRGIKVTVAGTSVSGEVDAFVSVRNCVFEANTGVAVEAMGMPAQGYPIVYVRDCVFSSNACALYCGFKSTLNATGCVFTDNGRVLEVDEQGQSSVRECTIVSNSSGSESLIECWPYAWVYFENTILAFNMGQVFDCHMCEFILSCCDVYGNSQGDYVGCIAGLEGTGGNFSADPLFCNYLARDLRLHEDSPCAQGNHPDTVDCGLIGALPADCSTPGTEPSRWGSIKALFAR